MLLLLMLLSADPLPQTMDERRHYFETAGELDLVAAGRQALEALGPVYRFTIRKHERVGGKLLPEQTMKVIVRQKPFAVRLEVVKGPATGRRVLYDETIRKTDLRVREPGWKSILGANWIDINGSLAHEDSNHTVRDLGFGPLLDIMASDFTTAVKYGGFTRAQEGLNAAGHDCVRFTAPPGAKGLHSQRSVLCVDLALGLTVEVDSWDSVGFLESYRYTEVEPNVAAPPDTFTLKGAGL